MKSKAIFATTYIDRRNERLSKEALDSMAEQINKSDTAILHTIEHDNTIPPIGKVIKAEVQRREDGEYQVVATQEYFGEIEWLYLENGMKLFKQQSKEDSRPFANRSYATEDFSVYLDWNNFEPKQDFQKFIEETQTESGVEFTHQLFGRKSLIPDPEIIVSLIGFGKLFGAYWLIKKTKTGEKIDEIASEEVEKFYKFVKTLVIKGAKYLKPENRPKTYVFIVSKNPHIEFIARTNDADKVISSVKIEKFKKTKKEISELINRFDATRIQCLLDENGEWKFNS